MCQFSNSVLDSTSVSEWDMNEYEQQHLHVVKQDLKNHFFVLTWPITVLCALVMVVGWILVDFVKLLVKESGRVVYIRINHLVIRVTSMLINKRRYPLRNKQTILEIEFSDIKFTALWWVLLLTADKNKQTKTVFEIDFSDIKFTSSWWILLFNSFKSLSFLDTKVCTKP